jgi:CBS domain-containing protein
MMHGSAIGCLVIVDRGRIVGIVTAADLLALIESRPRVGTNKRSTGRLSSHRRAALRMPAVPAPAP